MDMTINKINITETIKQVEDLLRSEKNASPSIQAMLRLLVMVINLNRNKKPAFKQASYFIRKNKYHAI